MKKTGPNVCVLMSTYNGERYVKAQVESILKQKNVDLQLIIRDDGSTDQTYAILEQYAKENANVHIYRGKNIGWKKSFMELVHVAPEAEFYSFSDQDDIWLEGKLERACSCLKEYVNEIVLYGSNVWVTDANLNIERPYCKENIDAQARTLIQRLDLCGMPGGLTYVFTPKVKLLMERWKPTGDYGHDFICYLLTTIFGKVIYDNTPTVLYRQHENNQIGASRGMRWWIDKKIQTLTSATVPNKSIWSEKVLSLYPEVKKNPEVFFILEQLQRYPYDKRIKLELLKNKKLVRNSTLNTILLRLKIWMNKW